jgi:hypothetical protein
MSVDILPCGSRDATPTNETRTSGLSHPKEPRHDDFGALRKRSLAAATDEIGGASSAHN